MRLQKPKPQACRGRMCQHDAGCADAHCGHCAPVPQEGDGASACNEYSMICYDAACAKPPCTVDHAALVAGLCCEQLAMQNCNWDCHREAPVHWGPACYEDSHGNCCTSICDGYIDNCSLSGSACPGSCCTTDCFTESQGSCELSSTCTAPSSFPGAFDDAYRTPHHHSTVCETPISNSSFGTSTPQGPLTPTSSVGVPQGFTCQWGNCGAQLPSSEALIAHVNAVHLPTSQVGTMAHQMLHSNNIQHECNAVQAALGWTDCLSLLPNADVPSVPLECPWGDCSHDPDALHDYGVPDLLQHLLSDHIGPHISDAAVPTSPTPIPKSEEDCSCAPTEGRPRHACGWTGCSECFETHRELTQHITDVHVGSGKAEYVCGWRGCPRAAEGRAFGQKQKLLRHIQTHTGYRPYVCSVCSKRFSETSTLAQHMRTHTLERPFKCDFPGCDKSFSVMGSLTIHKRVHSGIRPFKCPYPGCARSFSESSNLHKHLRVHRGDRFVCGECGQAFSSAEKLSVHRNSHANKSAQVVGGDRFAALPSTALSAQRASA